MEAAQSALTNVEFKIGGITFAPEAWQVVAIVFLLFLLLITIASMRRHFLEWAAKGAGFGVVLGFMLALVIEGFLVLGGRTALTEVMGWKNAPPPIQNALDTSRSKLINVLGDSVEVPRTEAQEPITVESLMNDYRQLNSPGAKEFRDLLCSPDLER